MLCDCKKQHKDVSGLADNHLRNTAPYINNLYLLLSDNTYRVARRQSLSRREICQLSVGVAKANSV